MAKKKLPATVLEYFREAGSEGGKLGGSKGGKARAAKLTPEQRSEIARKAAIQSAKVRSARARKAQEAGEQPKTKEKK